MKLCCLKLEIFLANATEKIYLKQNTTINIIDDFDSYKNVPMFGD